MKNNTCSHTQRQRRIWFELTKRTRWEQEKNKDCYFNSNTPKENYSKNNEDIIIAER